MPPNPKNLKPFKAGADSRRNLKGRPKLPDIREALAKVPLDPFRLGSNDRGWKANMDWFLRPRSVWTVLERSDADEDGLDRRDSPAFRPQDPMERINRLLDKKGTE